MTGIPSGKPLAELKNWVWKSHIHAISSTVSNPELASHPGIGREVVEKTGVHLGFINLSELGSITTRTRKPK